MARVVGAIAAPVRFADGLQAGRARGNETLPVVTGLRVLKKRISVKDNTMATYRVRLEGILLLEN
jgi:flavin-binding protein dodecin